MATGPTAGEAVGSTEGAGLDGVGVGVGVGRRRWGRARAAGRVHDLDRPAHLRVDQAQEGITARSRESDSIGLTRAERAAVDRPVAVGRCGVLTVVQVLEGHGPTGRDRRGPGLEDTITDRDRRRSWRRRRAASGRGRGGRRRRDDPDPTLIAGVTPIPLVAELVGPGCHEADEGGLPGFDVVGVEVVGSCARPEPVPFIVAVDEAEDLTAADRHVIAIQGVASGDRHGRCADDIVVGDDRRRDGSRQGQGDDESGDGAARGQMHAGSLRRGWQGSRPAAHTPEADGAEKVSVGAYRRRCQ